MALNIHRKDGWLYVAVGMWQPFSFFGAGGWIALSPRWLAEKFVYEVRRRIAVRRIRKYGLLA